MEVFYFYFNLLFANFILYIETVSLGILLIFYIDALKILVLKRFLFNFNYVSSSFNNKLLITAYSVIVLIYIGVVARYSISI